ncbi:MAG: NAD(P)H-hydrate epimerase [Synechococcus sp.]|nr:NAD(P)H-hydrate epimerase [Synechococcus sp.]
MPSAAPAWPPRDAGHLLVSAAEMAALEQQLFASGLPVAALMEKAALAMAQRLRAQLTPAAVAPSPLPAPPLPPWPRPLLPCGPRLAAMAALVLVGPGHNGGDGLVIARELHLAGIPVRLWSPFDRHRPLTEAHLRHALWLGIPRLAEPPDPRDPGLWIDALFGTGQNRRPGEPLEALLEARQRLRPGRLVAVDGPTGICADSGRLLGTGAATAALTWCLGLRKRGLLQDAAIGRVGHLELVPLDLPQRLLDGLPAATPLALGAADLASAPGPLLDPAAAKYGRGRLLLVSGSRRYRGAAALALAGASASGCGSLRAVLPDVMTDGLWLRHPDVLLEAGLPSDAAGALQLAPLARLRLERLDALLLGPGLGLPAAAAAAEDCPPARSCAEDREGEVWEQLRTFPGLLLLDADGLNRLAQRQAGAGAHWLRQRCGPSWLTPHRGEFDRLFPQWADQPPLAAAAAAAAASGAAVLLKGARSVVAAADGRLWQLEQAAAEAARAGLGDTLAGYAAGRGAMAMAAGAGALDASLLAAAALEHAQAGLRCLRRLGRGGVTPMAVAEELGRCRTSDRAALESGRNAEEDQLG